MVVPVGYKKTGILLVSLILITLFCPASAVPDPDTLVVVVTDAQNAKILESARVFLDGGYKGTTISDQTGAALSITGITRGKHTIRVTKDGYQEITRKIVFPEDSLVHIGISKELLVPIHISGPTADRIDIVFYPSSTSYDCKNHTKVQASDYITDEARFRDDITSLVSQTLLNLEEDTTGSSPLVTNCSDVFNFYYYYDPSAPADAFSGPVGTIPEKYFTEVPFSDLTVILYPAYHGIISDPTCQPAGCFQDSGPGRSLMKAPADQAGLFKHETGHAVFGLVDTYCGDTYYYQNDPNPNVWSTPESCRADADAGGRDPALCRQIERTSSTTPSCIRNYWRWDPQPDIMENGYGGKFGEAATRRIHYVIGKVSGGSL